MTAEPEISPEEREEVGRLFLSWAKELRRSCVQEKTARKLIDWPRSQGSGEQLKRARIEARMIREEQGT